MRQIAALALATLCILGISCGRETPLVPELDSRLVVYVQWDNAGLAEKRLEVVELGVAKLTDVSGIAEFTLPAGTYTLRAYGINVPGPPPAFVDTTVKTTRGETTRVEVIDCLTCR
jgi:hypothetical protein